MVPAVLSAAAVLLIELSPAFTVLFVVGFAGVFVLPIFVLRWAVGRNAIFADPRGLIAIVRGRAYRAAEWDVIRDASWYGGSLWLAWDPGGVLVTTDAGESRVGTVVIVRRRRRAEAGDQVLTYLAARLGRERATE